MNTTSFSEWFQEIIIILFLRWKLLTFITIATIIFTILFTFILPPIFSGHFSIIMRGNEQDAAMIQSGQGGYINRSQIVDTMTANEERLLNSSELAYQVVKKIKIDYPEPFFGWIKLSFPNIFNSKDLIQTIKDWIQNFSGKKDLISTGEPLIEELQDSIVVTPVMGTNVIEVSFTHSDPIFIKKILQTYLDTYLETREKLWMAINAPKFFEDQANNYFKAFVKTNEELHSIKSKNRVVNSAQEMISVQQEVDDLRSAINDLGIDISGLNNHLEQLKKMSSFESLSATSFQNESNKALSNLQESLERAITTRASTLKYFNSNSVDIQRIDREIAELSNSIKQNLTLHTKKQLNSKIHHINFLKKKRDLLIEQLLEIDKAETDISILQEKASILKETANLYETKHHETQISLELRDETFSNVAVITPPYVKAKPVFPQRIILFILAIFVGLFLGICGATLLEIMDDSFKLPKNIEKITGLPVLASFLLHSKNFDLEIPQYPSKKFQSESSSQFSTVLFGNKE